MSYTSIFTSSGKYRPATASKSSGPMRDYSQDFTPGQYAKVNAPAVARQQAAATMQRAAPKASAPAPPKSLFGKVKGFVNNNVVKPTVTTVDKSVNTVAAGAEGAAGLTKAVGQKVIGNEKGAAKTLQTTNRVINSKLTKGAGGKGAYLTPKQAQRGGTSLIKPAAQAVTDIAPLVVPVGNVAKGASLAVRAGRGAVDNALVGAGTDTANQVIQHKGLNKGEIAKSAAVAGLIGGVIPGVHEGLKTGVGGVKDATSTTAAKDLIKNQKTQTLLDKGRSTPEPSAGKPTTEATLQTPDGNPQVTYKPSNPQVKTIIEARQKQAEAVAAPAKAAEAEQKATAATAEKTQAQGQKIDRQIELIKAKGKDSQTGLSNVDKTKLTHLQQDKAQLEQPTGNVADVKPPTAQLREVAPKQTQAPTAASEKPVSASSGNSTPKNVAATTPSIKEEPATKVSGSALGTEAKAVAAGLTKQFEGKAEYSTGSFKNEAAKAVDLVKSDPQKAMDIAMGKTPGDNTIHEVAVAKALENKAVKEGDGETLRQLASSSRHTVTSEAAQRLGAEGYDTGSDVVKNIASLKKARQDVFEKRSGKKVVEAVRSEVQTAQKEMPRLKVKEWHDLVDSLKC